MPELIMLTGLSGSGKTEFANRIAVEKNAEVLTVDSIRRELALSGNTMADKNTIYGIARERAEKMLKDGRNVIFDSRNLSYRRRKALIDQLKYIDGFKAESYVLLRRPDECAKRLTDEGLSFLIPDELLIRQLRGFEFPVPEEGYTGGINFVNNSSGSVDLETEYARLKGVPQTGKYHLENADNHSRMVEEAARAMNISGDFVCAARYHDVGKVYAKVPGKDGVVHFPGHENISAYIYALTMESGAYSEDELHVLRLIQFHDLIYKDPVRFATLPSELQYELEKFHECDMYGAIVTDELSTIDLRQLIMAFDDWEEILAAGPYYLNISRDDGCYVFERTAESDTGVQAVRDADGCRIMILDKIPFFI